jgi:hypothetical protein
MGDEFATEKLRLASLLVEVPVIDGERNAVAAELRRMGFQFPETSNARFMCLHIIDWALRAHGAFARLVDLLMTIDGSDQAKRFQAAVRALPPSDMYSFQERLDFIRELEQFIPTAAGLGACYKLVTDHLGVAGAFERRALASAGDLVSEVEQITTEESCHPVIVLTEAVVQRSDVLGAAATMRPWGDKLAENLDGIDARGDQRGKLAGLRKSGFRRSARPDGRAKLVLQLEPSGPRHDRYLFGASLYLGNTLDSKKSDPDKPISLDEVRAALNDVLAWAIDRLEDVYDKIPPIDLEFVLPRDLLCEPIEEWGDLDTEDQQLQDDFVVVVRDLERQRNPRLRLRWRQKWQELIDNGPGTAMSRWITCNDPERAPGQLFKELRAGACFAVGLTFPPVPGVRGFRFNEVLNAGLPIAVWPRRRCEHTEAARPRDGGPCTGLLFKDDLCDRLADLDLQDLPQLVLGLRTEVADNADWSLALLWDDPGRCPRPTGRSLDVPREDS